MITRLKIENFKVFQEAEFPLRPLTVIVGPNASGKSTILQALEWWGRKILGVNPESDSLLKRGANGTLAVSAEWANTWFREPKCTNEVISTNRFRQLADPEDPPNWPHCVRISFEFGLMAAPFYSKVLPPELQSNGQGLAGVIANLQLEQGDQFRQIVEQLNSVVPVVEDVKTRLAYVELLEPFVEVNEQREILVRRRYSGTEILFDMQGASSVTASQVSEGTLFTLALLTLLNAPDTPDLVLIDDIERGLHPRAMGELIVQLRKLQEQNPDLQIVATSHSPYFLDYLKHEEILLTSLDEDGTASVAPLTDHPDFERWKDLLAPGEYWATAGEGWVSKKQAETKR